MIRETRRTESEIMNEEEVGSTIQSYNRATGGIRSQGWVRS